MMVQLINNIGIDFPPGVAVHDIVRTMLKDNWDSPGLTPTKAQIHFSDVGWLGNWNYQISTRQLPYQIFMRSGSGQYQGVKADVEINIWVRKLTVRKPGSIENMMQRISEIIMEHNGNLATGIQDPTMFNVASGMNDIVLDREFEEPGIDTVRMNLKRPTETAVWLTQGLATVTFFRYLA